MSILSPAGAEVNKMTVQEAIQKVIDDQAKLDHICREYRKHKANERIEAAVVEMECHLERIRELGEIVRIEIPKL